jgi:5-enolpyruvylshikimate-3-phosphate synthase
MNFAAAGLMIPGLDIVNPECVSKSYPQFWKDFARFTDHSG